MAKKAIDDATATYQRHIQELRRKDPSTLTAQDKEDLAGEDRAIRATERAAHPEQELKGEAMEKVLAGTATEDQRELAGLKPPPAEKP